jgi:hypothetical protein
MAVLVKFKCIVGEYEHIDMKIFDRKKSEWGYCKDFWCLKTKNELSDNCFWDDWMMNAIEVYSEKTISKKEVEQLNNIGVW